MYATESREGTSLDSGDYWRVIRRRRGILVAGILLGALLGLLFTIMSAPSYEAEASVLVRPVAVAVSQSSLRADQLVNLATEREIIRSAAVATQAAELMGADPESVIRNLDRLRVIIPDGAQILVIRYTAADPEQARAGAQAFAEAYLKHRGDQAVASLAERQGVLDVAIEQAQVALVEATETLVNSEEGTLERALAQADINLLSGRISDLLGNQADLQQLDVDPGETIAPAARPTGPTTQPTWLVVAIGAIVGGVISLPPAFLRERIDDRLWDVGDAEELDIATVLGTVPVPSSPDRRLDPKFPMDHTAEAYRRLSLNMMSMAAGVTNPKLAVASVGVGEREPGVVIELAAATARMGHHVLLVGTDEGHASLSSVLAIDESPGLAEVLTGGKVMTEVAQTVNSLQRLRIVVEGGDWNGELPWKRFSGLFDQLPPPSEILLVHTAPVLAAADTLRVSALMDSVVLVVHRRRTTRAALSRAAAELQQGGANVAGIIFVT